MQMYKTIPLLLTSLLAACGGGGGGDTAANTPDNSNTTVVTTPPAAATGTNPVNNANLPDGARLLASQCFQCHGTNGYSATGIESIAGDSESELVADMLEMKYSNAVDIMHYQAKGYSEAEIHLMAAYFAALPKSANGDND